MRRIAALAPLLLAALASPALAGVDARVRLAEAVAAHPDDADLSWALVRELADAGESADAEWRLAEHLARWPDRPAEGWLLLGRLRTQLGRSAEAVTALREAVRRQPESGAAHLQLGIALRQAGEPAQAEPHLEAAARLEPELADEAQLLQGLSRLDLGDEAGAEPILRALEARDPGGEAGRSARLLLRGDARVPSPALRVEAYSGLGYDSNVSLESGDDLAGVGSAQDDGRVEFGASIDWRALDAERGGIALGVRYDGSRYLDLHAYDQQRVQGSVGGSWRLRPWLGLRLDASAGYSLLDTEPYLIDTSLRPALLLSLGERAGLLRVFGEAERLDYDEEPFIDSLERDGWSYGGGLEQIVPLSRLRPGTWLAAGAGYARRETSAGTDLLGFESAYTHHRARGVLRGHVPLVWRSVADASLGFDYEHYDNANVIDALTADPADPAQRRDTVWRADVTLTRPVSRFMDAQIGWSYTDRGSNVDAYAYDRHIAGFRIRVHTP